MCESVIMRNGHNLIKGRAISDTLHQTGVP